MLTIKKRPDNTAGIYKYQVNENGIVNEHTCPARSFVAFCAKQLLKKDELPITVVVTPWGEKLSWNQQAAEEMAENFWVIERDCINAMAAHSKLRKEVCHV